MEQVVARVRIAVEGVEPTEPPEDEPVNRLRGEVSLLLAPLQKLVKARPGYQLAREHPRGAQLGQDMRHADDGVSLVVPGEHLLALRLAHVVDLFLQALA